MKKRNLNSLSLNKKYISGFDSYKKIQNPNMIVGGQEDDESSILIEDILSL
ncbi:hypothetical protein C8N46_108149 [Kordia periserrulae]|uniref:Uncharacterized protein n=1 Tax=Kordia periserrulae TaxID=701523 RepID=A0A2T6BUX4_9FLAO|nr:hypothetical protein [Kordia periserrulae]PTX59836.1 hypothetical protein C8N46_108149 [Kordia periserrulae]